MFSIKVGSLPGPITRIFGPEDKKTWCGLTFVSGSAGVFSKKEYVESSSNLVQPFILIMLFGNASIIFISFKDDRGSGRFTEQEDQCVFIWSIFFALFFEGSRFNKFLQSKFSQVLTVAFGFISNILFLTSLILVSLTPSMWFKTTKDDTSTSFSSFLDIYTSDDDIVFASIFISLMSFTIRATLIPFLFKRIFFNKVVLPDPKKPDKTVTGNFLFSLLILPLYFFRCCSLINCLLLDILNNYWCVHKKLYTILVKWHIFHFYNQRGHDPI